MSTFYRVHPATESPESILDERRWRSRVWVGQVEIRCQDCYGMGYTVDGDEREVRCPVCRGAGRVEDVRHGVSCCRTLDDLRDYFADRGADITGDVVIELEGEVSNDQDWDHESGAVLVLPSRIVSVTPADEVL